MHITVGLAILASCPAAPLHLVRIRNAGGKRGYLISLHLLLAILSLVTIPVTMGLMARALNFHAEMNIVLIIKIVGLLVILPVSLGILMRSRLPEMAANIYKSIAFIGNTILFLGILYLIVVMFQLMFKRLLEMDALSYIAMVLMVSIALTIGHFMAPREPEERMTLALESAARHPGFALLITSVNFSFDKASAILIPYFVVFLIISGLYIRWQKRIRIKDNPVQ
jgi:BASS family bile acid:Na+ symporter